MEANGGPNVEQKVHKTLHFGKGGHLGHFGLTCEPCKQTHATKSKTRTWNFGGTCKIL